MRSIHKRTLGIILLLVSWSIAHGTHISGANIEYECLGSDQYLITLNIFQDCSDANVSGTHSIRVVPDCNTLFYASALSLTSNSEVSQLCSALIEESSCNGGQLPGKRHLTYQGVVTIPNTCPEYRVMWKQNYRTPSVNVDNTSNLVFYTDARIRPQDAGCNDSPLITIQQVPYVCVGQSNSYNFGAVDVEGDSLVFSYTPALFSPNGNSFSPVTYEAGFSATEPIPGAVIDPQSGVLTFTAPSIGEYTIAVLVQQYDQSGVYIGSVTVDVNIVAEICPNPPPTLVDDSFVNFIGNASLTGPNTVEMCYGEFFCADIEFSSTVPEADIQVESNLEEVLPGATLTVTGGNPSTATVCWEANQFGLDGTVVLIANDDQCPIPGIVSFSFDVDVNQAVYAGPNTTLCLGESLQLQAVGDNEFNWEVLTGDPLILGTNFSCNPCSNPVVTPAVSTTYIVTGSGANAQCFNQDTISIDVSLNLNVSTTEVECNGDEGSLLIEILSGSGDYSIDFEGTLIPIVGSTFDSLAIAEGTYDLTIFDNGLSCSVNETVTITSSSFSPPDAGPDPSNALCILNYSLTGTSSGGALLWSAAGPGVVTFSPNSNVEAPTVEVSEPGLYTFYFNETIGLCSQTDSVVISLDGPIEVFAGNDTVVCGTNMVLSALQNYGSGAWVSSNPLVTFSPTASSPNATVTVPTFGSYTFFWSADGGNGCIAADDIQVSFLNFPMANAGADLVSCLSMDTLGAIAQNGSGVWTWPSGVNVNNAIDPNAVITFTGPAGTYTLTWTVSNAACSTSDTIQLEYTPSTLANAGFDLANICGLTATMEANGLAGQWSPQAGVTFTDPLSPTSSVMVTTPGVYALEWNLGSGVCASSDEVIVVFNPQPVAYAGLDQSICSNMTDLAALPSTGTGQWTAPAGVSLGDLNESITSITASVYGTYTLSWTETSIPGCASTDEVTITFTEQPNADAGSDISICGNSVDLEAIPSVGVGTWTFPPDLTVSPLTDPSATLTSSLYGSQTLTWTEDNGNGCVSADEVTVTFTEQPIAQAGPDSLLCGNQFQLQADPTAGTGTWTVPIGLNIDDITGPNAVLTATNYGSYDLTWTSDNGNGCTSSDQVTLTFVEQPNASAGADTTLCGTSLQMAAIPSVGAGAWSVPPEIFADDETSPNAIITATAFGSYTLTWTEDNGNGCASSDELQVTFNSFPNADAGDDQTICGIETELSASASIGTGHWTGPLEVFFVDPEAPNTAFSSSLYGDYILYWEEVSNGCSSIDSVAISFNEPPVAQGGVYAPFCGLEGELYATPSAFGGEWMSISGLSLDINDPSGSVSASSIGNYCIYWVVDDGTCSDSSLVELTFLDTPLAEAGPDLNSCGEDIALAATPSLGIGSWLGPPEITFSDITDPVASISASDLGSFMLYWQETSGVCQSIDSLTVNFSDVPSGEAGSYPLVCGNELQLAATPPSVGTAYWLFPSGISGDVNDPEAEITVASFGAYTVQWVTQVGQCSDTASVSLIFATVPAAEAGTDQAVCGLEVIMDASLDDGIGAWILPTGLTGDVDDPQTTLTSNSYSDFTVFWTIQDAQGCAAMDSLVLRFIETPVVEAGPDQSICGEMAELEATTSLGEGQWSGASDVSFSDPSAANSDVSGISGTYTLFWTATNAELCSSRDSLEIAFKDIPSAEILSPHSSVCGLESDLQALFSLPSSTGAWQGPSSISFSSSSTEETGVTSTLFGQQAILWIEDNEGCRDTATVIIQFDQLPNINAGVDAAVCGLTFGMGATADIGTGLWSGPLSFVDDTDPLTSTTAGAFGTYGLTWTVTNGACSASDEIGIQFLESPIADAGEDQDICGLEGQLAAIPSSGEGTWSLPSGLTIDDLNDPETSINSATFSSVMLTWTESNGVCSTTDEMNLHFYQPPSAEAGSDLEECGLSGELNAQPSVGAGTWSGPLNIDFSDVNDPNSTFNSSLPGNYTLTWTEVNGSCVDQESLTLQLNEIPTATAGEDAGQCGTSYTLQATPSVGAGLWTGSLELSFFPSPIVPNPTVVASAPGAYELIWTEQNGDCVDTDIVIVSFFDNPDTLSTSLLCLNGNTQYQVIVNLIGGDEDSYVATGDDGIFIGSTYNSQIFDIQESYSFSLSDENECEILLIEGEASCPSLSNAGLLDLDTLHVCPGEIAVAIVISTGFLDPDDVQSFYLHDAPFGIGDVFSISSNPSFTLQAGMVVGEVYYISAAVGNDDGTGAPDLNAEGTDISAAVPVVFHASPQISGIPTELSYCEGEEVLILMDFTGQSPFTVNFALDGIPDDFEAAVNGPQTLTFAGGELLSWLEMSDRYCSIILDQNTELETLGLPSFSTQESLSFCTGSQDSLILQLTGEAPWQWSWSNDSGDGTDLFSAQNALTFIPPVSGQYTFTNLSDANCTSEASTSSVVEILALPLIDAGQDLEVCLGDDVQIGSSPISGYGYEWQPNDLLEDLVSPEPLVSLNLPSGEPQVITFLLSVSDENCSSTDEVTITWNPLPENTSIDGEAELCIGESVTLTAMGGVSFDWEIESSDSSSATIMVSPMEDTVYEVNVFNVFGCSVQESINLIVRALPEVDLIADQSSGCPPLSIEVMNLAPLMDASDCQWALNNGTFEQNTCETATTYLENPGNYLIQLSITDIYGCVGVGSTDTITINDIKASFITYPDLFSMDDTLFQAISTSNGQHAAEWFLDDESIGQGVSSTLPLDVPRPDFYEFCLIVTSEDGCLDTVCKDIEISSNVKVWVPTGFTPNEDDLNTGFSAVVDGQEYVSNYSLQVFDRKGVMVFDSNELEKPWSGQSERGAENPQGVYHWLITMNVFGEAYPREYRGTVTLLR